MKNNLTLVTALFDLGRDKLSDGFSRSFDHYLNCFRDFLDSTKDFPLVIFTEEKVESLIWEIRDRSNTVVLIRDEQFLRTFPFYNQIQEIRKNPNWYGQAGWLAESPQAKLELYNPLVMMKQFMLNDASLMNHFDTKYFLWLDAGLTNTVHLRGYLDENFERRISNKLNKMLYLCFPYDGQNEVHGFRKDKMNSYSGRETTYVARGGCFGGTKDAINAVNDVYYGLLTDTMREGLMGTEESLFTILSYRHPDLIRTHMIDSNGLVYKFFEDLREIPVTQVTQERMAFYVLTFNFPDQFKMLVDSFVAAYPKEFKEAKKYVVNNSTDPSVNEAYQELFQKHGFTEFAFPENIGINSARQFCAEHFDQSGHEFMVFFEDDMLMHDRDLARRCKNGFSCWQPDLYDKAMHILELEGLDYVKLSFTEFYGDNHMNWAWHNVPSDRKKEYFTKKDDHRAEQKVVVDYTGTFRGLPYAVGQFHYCNWPLVFNKRGNRKVFLDTKWAHPFEQTLMSHTMTLIHEGKVRAGCLYASPINHYRAFHYPKGVRKENKG